MSPPGQPALPGPPTPLPCRGAARTGPWPHQPPHHVGFMLLPRFPSSFLRAAPVEGKEGHKGRGGSLCPLGRALPRHRAAQPGTPPRPCPGRAPRGKRPDLTHAHTGTVPGSPQPLLTGPRTDPSIPGPSRYSLPPHPGRSRYRARVPPLPSRGRTRVSPSRQRARLGPSPWAVPARRGSRGRRCLPGRDNRTRSPSATAPHRSNQQQDGGARAGGARRWPS